MNIFTLTEVCARRYKHFTCFSAYFFPFEFVWNLSDWR